MKYLVGGFKHGFYFPFHIWDVILPIDELIFFKMVIAPPTIFFGVTGPSLIFGWNDSHLPQVF